MKVKVLYILLAAVCLTSCDGFHSSSNGDLDGMWHLEEVDTLYLSTWSNPVDYSGKGIFWSVQDKLLCLDDHVITDNKTCLMRFEHQGDELRVFNPYFIQDRPEPDQPIDDVIYLKPFGINELDETFYIETLSRKKMVLWSKTLRLKFKKF